MKIVNALVGALMLAAPAVGHAATTIVTDGGFEAKGSGPPTTTTYCYEGQPYGSGACATGGFTGAGNAGVIKSNNSDWGFTTAASGNYFGFVQTNGTLSQDVLLHTGRYLFSWDDAARTNNGGDHSYDVSIGGTSLGQYTTTGSGFSPRSIVALVSGGPGTYTLKFAGINSGQDTTSFLDNVSIAAVPEPGIWAMMIAGFGIVGGALRRRKVAALCFA